MPVDRSRDAGRWQGARRDGGDRQAGVVVAVVGGVGVGWGGWVGVGVPGETVAPEQGGRRHVHGGGGRQSLVGRTVMLAA